MYPSPSQFLSNANINNQSLYGVWSFDVRYEEEMSCRGAR